MKESLQERRLSPLARSNTLLASRKNHRTLLQLPEEVLLLILKKLPAKNLIFMRAVNTDFRNLVENNSTSLWSAASFRGEWPSTHNYQHFEKAANLGNIEASIKLAVAHLYNEGVPGDKETQSNATATTKYLSITERAKDPTVPPFMWLFIRPPWTTVGVCCKSIVSQKLQQSHSTESHATNCYCVGKILSFFEDEEKQQEAGGWFERAAASAAAADQHHFTAPAYTLWTKSNGGGRPGAPCTDPGSSLQSVRQLRDLTKLGNLNAKLALLHHYARGNYGGLSRRKATTAIRQFFQASPRPITQDVWTTNNGLSSAMRYILVDWLVEVSGMKGFNHLTLHLCVGAVDCYLREQQISRANLQLVGISALVVISRYMEREIVTVREAAWLTDSTYQYEEVVRMMAETVATLAGRVRRLTAVDYLDLLCPLAGAEPRARCLALYVLEVSLHYIEFGAFPLALLAAGCLCLARLTLAVQGGDHHGPPAPADFALCFPDLTDLTGFTRADLAQCILFLHRKVFLEPPLTDHRNVTLVAVRQRYEDEEFLEVSKIDGMDQDDLKSILGYASVSDTSTSSPGYFTAYSSSPSHISLSPLCCHGDEFFSQPTAASSCRAAAAREEDAESERVLTPVGELSESSEVGRRDLDLSFNSGYEGDEESDDEERMAATLGSGLEPFPGVEGCVLVEQQQQQQQRKKRKAHSPSKRSSLSSPKLARQSASQATARGHHGVMTRGRSALKPVENTVRSSPRPRWKPPISVATEDIYSLL